MKYPSSRKLDMNEDSFSPHETSSPFSRARNFYGGWVKIEVNGRRVLGVNLEIILRNPAEQRDVHQ